MSIDPTSVPHQPVLLDQVVESLSIQPNDIILDGTLGFGGHAATLIERLGPAGMYIGLDRDPSAVKFCQTRFAGQANVHIFQSTFAEFPLILEELKIEVVQKVLLDLGVSSWQIDQAKRGFSYLRDEPLDMRMQNYQIGREKAKPTPTVADFLAKANAEQLKQVFTEYGEIRNSQKLIEQIIQVRSGRPIRTTGVLLEIIKKSFFFHNQRVLYLRTCAQVFQALRIALNQEMTQLETFLSLVPTYIAPAGRLAVIAFHSLEDRQMKDFGRLHKHNFQPVGKKVMQVSYADAKHNTRAKSAKLRVLAKTA